MDWRHNINRYIDKIDEKTIYVLDANNGLEKIIYLFENNKENLQEHNIKDINIPPTIKL